MSGLVAWVQGRYQGRKVAVGKGSDDATGTWWWSFMIHDNPWIHDSSWWSVMIFHDLSWSMGPWRSMTIHDDAWWSVVIHDDPRWFLMLVAWVLFVFYTLGQNLSLTDPGHSFRKLKTMSTVKLKHWTIWNMQYALCWLVAIIVMLTKRIISTMNDGGDGNAIALMIAICDRVSKS